MNYEYCINKLPAKAVFNVMVNGDLAIHGVTKPVGTEGTVPVNGEAVKAVSDFNIKLEDYGVNDGIIAAGKVSKEPTIAVKAGV